MIDNDNDDNVQDQVADYEGRVGRMEREESNIWMIMIMMIMFRTRLQITRAGWGGWRGRRAFSG